MAAQTIKMRIQFRRDTTENWLLYKDVVPAAGEPCFDMDLKTLKIGDGVTTYENLPSIGGVDIKVDDKSLVLKDGVLQLLGFETAEVGAQPRKNANNEIEWVIPAVTVDELSETINTIKTEVKTIQEIVTPSTEGSIPLLSRLETLETKMDGTGEGTVDAKIDAKIEAFASMMTPDDDKINTLMELINYVETHGKEAIEMATDVANLQELVGEGSVDERIAAAVADKIVAEEGKSLISDTLIAKLEAIEENAQVNKIDEIYLGNTLLDVVDKKVVIPIGAGLKTSDEIEVAEDGTLSIKSISFDKIAQTENQEIVLSGGGAAG
jgi:hypothetical protein